MRIEICSFSTIETIAKTEFEPGTYLISIRDSVAEQPVLEFKPDKILWLVFDDIGEELLTDTPMQKTLDDEIHTADMDFRLVSDNDAKRIADFVLCNQNNINVLICQCECGQSRSAGCAAAISEFLYGNGIEIFADDRYHPNKMVYRKTLAALIDRQENTCTEI